MDQAEKVTQLRRSSLSKWKFKVKNSKYFAEKRCRPPLVSEDLRKEMIEAVILCDNETVAMKMTQFRQLVHKRLREEDIKPYGYYMKSDTLKNFLKNAGMSDSVFQEKDASRTKAEADIRNFVTCFVATKACSEDLHPAMKTNFDSTQAKWPTDRNKTAATPTKRKSTHQGQSESVKTDFPVFVKLLTISTANNDHYDLIFIIADSRLDAEVMHHRCFDGLDAVLKGKDM